jgi:N-acetylmuramic acid 6-phosphate etherase
MSEEVLGALPTEARDARTAGFDGMSAMGMMEAMHRADGEALAAVGRALGQVAAVVEAAAARVGAGGRLLYFGAGTSGRLGVLDASECPPTFCTPPEMVQGVIAGGERALRFAVEGAEDDAALGAASVRALGVTARDVVVGIAASGRTPYVLGALAAGRAAGALTVGVSCVPGSAVELAGLQEGALAVTMATGAEVVTGSTRLKAGTATKLVLNMVSTGVLARLGYVYGNLMVNVQTTNAKLRDRAERIVVELTGLGRGEAAVLLERAGGVVKTAVVMQRLGVDADGARERLAAADGRLRGVLG